MQKTNKQTPVAYVENEADAAVHGGMVRSDAPPTTLNGGVSLKKFMLLSIGAAILTIALKTGAYLLTGSVGLLSDAIESLVNLAAASMALVLIAVAERPPDEEHSYGHTKAEYFSSGIEGA